MHVRMPSTSVRSCSALEMPQRSYPKSFNVGVERGVAARGVWPVVKALRQILRASLGSNSEIFAKFDFGFLSKIQNF